MSGQTVTLVCGFGRCGTSLVMQMLAAGGFGVTGKWPSFEVEAARCSSFDGRWIAARHGKAVKVLGQQYDFIKLPRANYRIIWLDRNFRQQARSAVKFARHMMGMVPTPASRDVIRKLAASYRKDRPAAMRKLEDLGPVSFITFEDLIEKPKQSAIMLCHILDLDIGMADSMAAVVRPRLPDCYPGLLEKQMLSEIDARGVVND